MDLDLTPLQSSRLNRLRLLVEARGTEQARAAARNGIYDRELDAALHRSGVLTDATLLERCLLVEEAGYLGLGLPLGATAIVADVLSDGLPPDAIVALSTAAQRGPVRFAPAATHIIFIGESGAASRVAEVGEGHVSPVASSFPFPYGTVDDVPGVELSRQLTTALRRRWKLAAAAEIAGCLRAATRRTATHLAAREQFGVKLASFQALQHRMANLVVSMEATSWLTRLAADRESDSLATQAADYARGAAAVTCSEVTQLTGARGLTIDFELFIWSMRMTALRLELVSLTQSTAPSLPAAADL